VNFYEIIATSKKKMGDTPKNGGEATSESER
jgi:hypothetical protein